MSNVKKFCPNATIVHVDVDPTSISKTIKAHIPVVGCLDTVLKQLQDGIDKSTIQIDRSAQEDWWRQIISWREQKCLGYKQSPSEKIKPQAVIEALYKATDGEAYISSDVGQHQMFAAQGGTGAERGDQTDFQNF